jgi:hypothetical protein
MTDVTAPIDPATFEAVKDLIGLITDAPACKARTQVLQRETDRCADAQAKLAGERDAHAQKVAADTAALDAREKALCAREVKLAAGEGALRRAERILAERQEVLNRQSGRFEVVGPGGLVRDFVDRSSPEPDPHYPRSAA